MSKLSLTKSGLQKERNQLNLYERVLPSLDLKREQLTIELSRAKRELDLKAVEIEELKSKVSEQVPMIANSEIPLSGLVNIDTVEYEEENVVGVNLPVLKSVKYLEQDYSLLAKPHWVDVYVKCLKQIIQLRLELELASERVKVLEKSVRRITQRVNLFDKVLIPSAKENIKRIQIFLGDAERSAVVRSKIAKTKHKQNNIDQNF